MSIINLASELEFRTVLFGVVIATYGFFWTLLHLTQDSREPPIAPCSVPIPFIGPIIEMKLNGTKFPLYIKSKFPKDIYTVRVLATHLYFINSIDLIPLVQRHFRTLSFDPPIIDGLRSILGVSQPTLSLLREGVTATTYETSFLHRVHKSVQSFLSPGESLDTMNGVAVSAVETSLSDLELRAEGGSVVVNLFDWVQETVIRATTDSVFGPDNPFRDAENIASWVEFERDGMPLLATNIPELFVPKRAIHARERLVAAFGKYFSPESNSTSKASAFFQGRLKFYIQEGIPQRDINRLGIADNIAFSSNLVPTSFWLLYHIFSNPVVLRECRGEVAKAVLTSQQVGHDGSTTQTINYTHLKNHCPTLQSTLKEVFRMHGVGLVARRALDDVMLDDEKGRYLIKKGGMILIPYKIQHYSEENWGENPRQFNHRRHLKENMVKQRGKQPHEGAALRGFGYGVHLCPGRHLATAELLCFAAMVMLRFDMVPINMEGGKEWPKLEPSEIYQVSSVGRPDPGGDSELKVELRVREGVRQTEWMVNFSSSA